MNKLSAIILLAGFSSRMGEPKQHVKIGEKTFLERIVSSLASVSESLDQCYFVGQNSDEKGMGIVRDFGGKWISNPKPEDGPLSSIRLAINEIAKDSALLLWPVDHPMIKAETVLEIIAAWQSNPQNITVPSIEMRRGHPTIFPANMKPDFFEAQLNKGAKVILQKYPDRITHVETDDAWVRKNLNTPELVEEAANVVKNCLETK